MVRIYQTNSCRVPINQPHRHRLTPDREVPQRLAREVLVHRSNTTEALHPETLVRRVNSAKKPSILGTVIAARRLPSGDLILTTDLVDTKRQLEADTTWLQALGRACS